MAKAQHESQFAEITPVTEERETVSSVAVTVHMPGIASDIHNGADPATVESVLRILKLC